MLEPVGRGEGDREQAAAPRLPPPQNPPLTQGAGEGTAPSLHLFPGGRLQDLRHPPHPRVLPEIKQQHPGVRMPPKGAGGSPPAPLRVAPSWSPDSSSSRTWDERGGAGAEEPTKGGALGWGGLSPSVATEDLEVFREPRCFPCVFMQHPKIGEVLAGGGRLRSCCSPSASRCASPGHRPGSRWGRPAGTAGSSAPPSPPSPAAAAGAQGEAEPTTHGGRATPTSSSTEERKWGN